MKIYIVISRFKKIEDWTNTNISQEAYKTLEEAIDFCKSKMNNEEIERHDFLLKHNYINNFYFDTKNYIYTIKELNVKEK